MIDDLSEPLPAVQPDPAPFGNPLHKLYNCQVITLPEPPSSSDDSDPLTEDLYFRAHRRFERQEKHLRNIERDRAQHEKQHLDRLLEELRSQDWLRVMGLTGVHENEKKLYEPKRKILIDELVVLVNKFQKWKDEERKRKLAKDKQLPAGDADSDPHHVKDSTRKHLKAAEEAAEESSPLSDALSTPDPSDVDALAARQLHQEARSASVAKQRKAVPETRKSKPIRSEGDHSTPAPKTKANAKRTKQPPPSQSSQDAHTKAQEAAPPPSSRPPLSPPAPAYLYIPPPPDKPFTSFFENSHQREVALAAINGTRRSRTHTVLAFGQPLPDMPEREFDPPEEILTDEALHASQRQRRLLKRRHRG